MISNGIKVVLKWASNKEKPRMQEIHCCILQKCYRGKITKAPQNYCLRYKEIEPFQAHSTITALP